MPTLMNYSLMLDLLEDDEDEVAEVLCHLMFADSRSELTQYFTLSYRAHPMSSSELEVAVDEHFSVDDDEKRVPDSDTLPCGAVMFIDGYKIEVLWWPDSEPAIAFTVKRNGEEVAAFESLEAEKTDQWCRFEYRD